MLPKLGIIAGGGRLPLEIANIYQAQSGQCCIAALIPYANLELLGPLEIQSFKMGSAGAILEYFNKCGVKNIIFAGHVKRPSLSSIKVDVTGAILLAKIIKQKFLGDDQLLRVIANFVESKGFKIISASDILSKEKSSLISTIKPLKQDQIDIELGCNVAISLGKLDIGQSVIVQDGYVLGVEAAEGTDNLIKRCAILRKKPSGGVLIKMMKSTQDVRLDIPTIGPDTIALLAEYKYKGAAIQKDGVIIIDPETTIRLANQHKIFLTKI